MGNNPHIRKRRDLSHIKIDKAFINPSSFAKQTYFLNEYEDPLTIERICDRAERVYLILYSDFLDVIGKQSFAYKRFRSKIQEVVIDDGIGRARADLLFSKRDPLVICGKDYAYRNVSRQQHRIGFLVNKDRNYFVQAVHNSLLEAYTSYSSVSLVIRECEGDYSSTVSNLNILLQENVDLIIDFSLCQESSMYAGERCRSRNVPLISVDFVAPGAVYFGADNARAGAIAGEKAQRYIENCWDGRLEHLVVLGKHGYDPVTRLRISGALEYIEQSIDFKAEKVDTIEWGNPEKNPTQDLITVSKKFKNREYADHGLQPQTPSRGIRLHPSIQKSVEHDYRWAELHKTDRGAYENR
jgi:hypothetical protein